MWNPGPAGVDEEAYKPIGHVRVVYEDGRWDSVTMHNLYGRHNILVIPEPPLPSIPRSSTEASTSARSTEPISPANHPPFDMAYLNVLNDVFNRDPNTPAYVHSEPYLFPALPDQQLNVPH